MSYLVKGWCQVSKPPFVLYAYGINLASSQVETEASTRTESAAEMQGLNPSPWTPQEQQLLEQALKTYPSSMGTER